MPDFTPSAVAAVLTRLAEAAKAGTAPALLDIEYADQMASALRNDARKPLPEETEKAENARNRTPKPTTRTPPTMPNSPETLRGAATNDPNAGLRRFLDDLARPNPRRSPNP